MATSAAAYIKNSFGIPEGPGDLHLGRFAMIGSRMSGENKEKQLNSEEAKNDFNSEYVFSCHVCFVEL